MPFILSQMLEFCRWAGALVVLAVHSTNMLLSLQDIMDVPHAPPVYAWWFFSAFELGHQAVIAFFVMSGYLVGGSVINSIRKERDFVREYFIHRCARIYVVTVPALLVTLICDTIGRHLLSDPSIYDMPVFAGHFGAAILAGNIANLQEIFCPVFGTNSPLWSLACEFWYYVSFPLLLAPLARNYSKALRYGGFALGLAIVLVFGAASEWFRFGFILWGIGALASLPKRPFVASRWLAAAMYVAAAIPIRLLIRGPLLAAHPWLQDAADLVGTILFSNLMLTVRYSSTEGWDLLRPDYHRKLADFSFSLYSVHMPILILLRGSVDSAMGRGWATQVATPGNWAVLFSVMSAIIMAAYGFSRLTEARTGAARRFLSAALPRFAMAPAE